MTGWKRCSACPVSRGVAECQCLDAELPSVHEGTRLGGNNPIHYVPEPEALTAAAVPLFNTMSDEEERGRMRAFLAPLDMLPEDVDFFIDRTLYKDTFKTLAERYNMPNTMAAFRRYREIFRFLKRELK